MADLLVSREMPTFVAITDDELLYDRRKNCKY